MHGDGDAELDAFLRVVRGELERGAGDPGGQGGDTWAGAIEGHHRQLEAVVLFAEQVSDGNLGVVEGDRRRVGRPQPHLVLVLVDGDRVVLGHDEGRDAPVAGVLVGLGVDRVPVGVAAVGDEALRAVDHVSVAAANRGRAHARDVRAGIGLGQAEGSQLGLLGEHPQVLRLDLVRSRQAGPVWRPARWHRSSSRSPRSPRRAPRQRDRHRSKSRRRPRTRSGRWEFIRPSSQAFSMISCGQVPSRS